MKLRDNNKYCCITNTIAVCYEYLRSQQSTDRLFQFQRSYLRFEMELRLMKRERVYDFPSKIQQNLELSDAH